MGSPLEWKRIRFRVCAEGTDPIAFDAAEDKGYQSSIRAFFPV